VTMVYLLDCGESASGVLAELQRMPSLRTLVLPASCAERAVDAEAVCGLTTLTTLRFRANINDAGVYVEEAGEWVLDFSRLTTLTCLDLGGCFAVTDKEVRELSDLTGLTDLDVACCRNITSEGLLAVSYLPALTALDLTGCDKVTAAGVQALRNTTAAPYLYIEWEPPAEVEEDAEDSDDSEDGEEWEEWDYAPPLYRTCSWVMQSGMMMSYVYTVPCPPRAKLSQPLSRRLLRLRSARGPLHTAPSWCGVS
jgi:hypothetical protein